MAKDTDKKPSRGQALSLPSPRQMAKLLNWGPDQSPLKFIIRYIPEGVDTFMTILQSSPDPNVQRFVKAWLDLTATERQSTTLEKLCETCDVSPAILVQEFSRESFQLGADIARGMAGMAQMSIMAASIELASKPNKSGTAERKMHFAASRYTPAPRSAVFMDKPVFNSAGKQPEPTGTDLAGVPDFSSESRQIAARARQSDEDVIDAVPLSEDE